MTAILMIIIVLLLVLIGWMWNSLGSIEKKTKITCMIVGVLIVYIITFIIFNISKIGITYEDETVMRVVRNVLVALFTIINGYIILPYTFKRLEQINNEEIEKDKLVKSFIILLIIILIIAIFEVQYLGNSQHRILNIMNK